MQLREFIANVFEEIVDGITEAQKATKNRGCLIAPMHGGYECNEDKLKVFDITVPVNTISFEIVLAEENSLSERNSRGIGVLLSHIGAGGQKEKTRDGQVSSKTSIRFSVPIIYPNPDISKD